MVRRSATLLRLVARSIGLRRSRLAAPRLAVERHLLTIACALHPSPSRQSGRILCYHATGTPDWGVNDVAPNRFQDQLELAFALGYRFVPAEQIQRGGGDARDLAITFDDGLSSVATNAAPILRHFGVPWSLFVVSRWADGDHEFGSGLMLGWREIESLAAQGVEVGSHSASHRNFRHLSAAEVEDELFESRRTIEARTGISPGAFAIPFGRSRDWSHHAGEVARAAGYGVVYAQSEARRPRDSVGRTFVTRFDDERIFRAALAGAFDDWEEWT